MHHEFCFEFSFVHGRLCRYELVRTCLYDVKRRTTRDKWGSGALH
jgi:hypothetical protein